MGTVYGSVAAIADVGPRLRRIVFDVPDLAALNLPGAGDEALGIYFGTDEAEGRNYTVRYRGPAADQITCDFVLHQRGLASDWARQVQLGATVVLDHARGWYHPESTSNWQLLIADLSGLPALARIMDELPAGTEATVIVEVAERADLDYLPTRPDLTVITSVGTGNGHAPSRLPELAGAHTHALSPEKGRGYCWFAGEAVATREVRKQLRSQHGWVADQYDIVGYWRFDSETWDRKYEAVSDEVEAVYARALAEGKGDKLAAEEYDIALERVGL
jgi:NADPH-dependent ferric siderophore reductase